VKNSNKRKFQTARRMCHENIFSVVYHYTHKRERERAKKKKKGTLYLFPTSFIQDALLRGETILRIITNG
jgi:hypothetical protein